MIKQNGLIIDYWLLTHNVTSILKPLWEDEVVEYKIKCSFLFFPPWLIYLLASLLVSSWCFHTVSQIHHSPAKQKRHNRRYQKRHWKVDFKNIPRPTNALLVIIFEWNILECYFKSDISHHLSIISDHTTHCQPWTIKVCLPHLSHSTVIWCLADNTQYHILDWIFYIW